MTVESPVHPLRYDKVLNNNTYQLLDHYFEHNGLDRTRSRVAFNIGIPNPQPFLLGLNNAIERRIPGLPKTPTFSRDVLKSLPPSLYGQWTEFLGSFNKVLMEDYLLITGEVGSRVLVTQQALAEAVRKPRRASLFATTVGFWPGAVALNLNSNNVQIEDFYCFRTTLNYQTYFKYGFHYIEKLKETVTNPHDREYLRKVTANYVGLRSNQAAVPRAENLSIKLVTAQGNLPTGLREKFSLMYTDVMCAEVPSLAPIAYFVLNILTDKIEAQPSWKDYLPR